MTDQLLGSAPTAPVATTLRRRFHLDRRHLTVVGTLRVLLLMFAIGGNR